MVSCEAPNVGSASGKFRDKLYATSGMLLFKLHEADNEGTISHSEKNSEVERVLHSTCWATRNFQIKIALVNKISTAQQIYAALKIQCYYRGCMARRHYLFVRDKIIKLQASFKRMRARKEYRELYTATLSVQKHWRVTTARRHLLQSLRFKRALKNRAATVIQAIFRGWSVRCKFHRQCSTEDRNQQHEQGCAESCQVEAARKIQSAIRFFLFRRSCQVRSKHITLSKHNDCIFSQQTYATWSMDRASCNKAFSKADESEAARVSIRRFDTTAASIIIQSHFRGYQTRKSTRHWQIAAKVIQRCWRQRRCMRSKEQGDKSWNWIDEESDRTWQASGVSMSSTHEELVTTYEVCSSSRSSGHQQWDGNRLLENKGMQNSNVCHVTCTPSCRRQLSRLKQNEQKLQKYAQVFLLHHYIVAQQQRAQCAPPFPPHIAPVLTNSKACGKSTSDNASSFQRSERMQKVPLLRSSVPESGTEVILDVAALLRSLEQVYSSSASMSKGSSENMGRLSDTEIMLDDCHDCITGAKNPKVLFQKQHRLISALTGRIDIQRMGLPDVRTFFAVVVAVVIYSRTLCHNFFFGPKKFNDSILPHST
ncbi:hypothetical protein O6H91_05G102900 [Diphasiastrum complanatum]|nr:hypothetical protein O6H91_Y357000 [Diphasiastrum complanatum]KAJ7282171.1 hypothetical protein O6H91_Y357000 [Diphasiastrum complanatum]KAJ7282172.1 hypothetical protein O6H91_Y357000 [Diphasiastrum complanatum]KAJ7282174.1 hypothetical protein O6H91_Y357000 [Diphasiastrum complanatum]KAJ7556881.1 hypothetical protein O6H91_05G102900 [Diphasiastrum complanatum]